MATVQTRCRNAYYVLTLLWVQGLKQSSQMSLRRAASNLNSNTELFIDLILIKNVILFTHLLDSSFDQFPEPFCGSDT